MFTTHPALLISGAIAMAWAVAVFFLKRNRFRRWNKASGIIVGTSLTEGNDPADPGNTTPNPRINFTTTSGQTVEFVSSSYSPLQGIGDKVSVLYDPSEPKKALIDSPIGRHMGELLLFCLGLGVVIGYFYKTRFSN